MSANVVLKTVGKLEALVYRLPVVGEPLIRGLNRAAAHAAFRAPVLGGKRGATVQDVRDGWLEFLARAGIRPVITEQEDMAFHWEMDRCPYGFRTSEQKGLCDAVMDLDRTYTRLLGAELVITDRIPHGSTKCRYTTRLVRR